MAVIDAHHVQEVVMEMRVENRVHPGMVKPEFIKGLRVDTSELPEWYGFDFSNTSLLMAALPNPFGFGKLVRKISPGVARNPVPDPTKSPVSRASCFPLRFSVRRFFSTVRSLSCFSSLFGTSVKPVVPV